VEDRDHQEGDRAPRDRMKLLAQAPADVADARDAPDMLGSAFAIALTPAARPWRGWRRTNASSIGGSLNTGEMDTSLPLADELIVLDLLDVASGRGLVLDNGSP
jgi:hypothetical protein